MQCQIVFARSVADVDGDRCRRSAIVACESCGNEACSNCSDSCYECGRNFCNPFPNANVTCLDQHAKETGHQVDLPKHKIPMSGELIESLFEAAGAVLAVNRG